MARNRMLNPEFWLDEEIAKLSPHARLLYMGLWGICDDNYATLPNRPDWIKAQVFPYEQVKIENLLGELKKIGKIVLFEAENKEYWYIKNFLKYQKVEHPSIPKYPSFSSSLTEPSPSPHRVLTRKLSKVKLSKVKLSKYNINKEEESLIFLLKDWNERQTSPIKGFEPKNIVKKYGVAKIDLLIEKYGQLDKGFGQFLGALKENANKNL